MSLLASRDGSVWISAIDRGVARLRNGELRRFTAGLPEEFVTSMYEDSDGTIWLGTNGGGLARFRDGRFSVATIKQGLFDDTIFQVLEDNQGNLWMSSNRGVFRVNKGQLNNLDRKSTRLNSSHLGISYA